MLEAGFCRSRETVNVLVECVFDTCLCGFLFYTWGYAFMFGARQRLHRLARSQRRAGGPSIAGSSSRTSPPTTLYGTTGVPVLAHWVFQFAFADCASTICSGTMIGRTDFIGDILYSVCVSGFIYPIIGHWAWGPDGFLVHDGRQNASTNAFTHFLPSFGMNFHDFAGSTVVHSIGGWIAIGRRHHAWAAGSAASSSVTAAARCFRTTWSWASSAASSCGSAGTALTPAPRCRRWTSAASAASPPTPRSPPAPAAWRRNSSSTSAPRSGTPAAITNGFLAGLVAITCPCYWVSPTGACCLGAVAGVIVILGVDLLEFLRIDDPIGAWPVHGLCGIWGTLSLGLFASGEYSAAGSQPDGRSADRSPSDDPRPHRPVLRRRLQGARGSDASAASSSAPPPSSSR